MPCVAVRSVVMKALQSDVLPRAFSMAGCSSGRVFCCPCSCAGHAQTQTPRASIQTVLARAATVDEQMIVLQLSLLDHPITSALATKQIQYMLVKRGQLTSLASPVGQVLGKADSRSSPP